MSFTKILHLLFEVLSHAKLDLIKALSLAKINTNSMTLTKKITLICKDNKIIKVFYPQKNIENVIYWIKNN
ncbi:MAG: hypothetical protein COA66_10385 [Arcobacter sp.]|nr:MAG: hypothetical protein COA66_10385 [Arcobacter sp.]